MARLLLKAGRKQKAEEAQKYWSGLETELDKSLEEYSKRPSYLRRWWRWYNSDIDFIFSSGSNRPTLQFYDENFWATSIKAELDLIKREVDQEQAIVKYGIWITTLVRYYRLLAKQETENWPYERLRALTDQVKAPNSRLKLGTAESNPEFPEFNELIEVTQAMGLSITSLWENPKQHTAGGKSSFTVRGKSTSKESVRLHPGSVKHLAQEQKHVFDKSKSKSKPRERSFLPINVNGETFHALPDTMSAENIMNESLAKKLGIAIHTEESKQRTFMEACGRPFQSLGEAIVSVSFPGECVNALDCRFSVVKTCTAPLIMGDSFLRATETLTKYRHRLERIVTSSMKKYWRLCYAGVPRRRLSCFVDFKSVQANADTGSDVDLVSRAYAFQRGWKVKKLRRGKGFVQLANKTIVKVSGYVKLRLSIDKSSKPKRKIFYVLDGLVCDVLLGDATLEEFDVFNQYESSFVDVVHDPEAQDCHNINWVEKMKQRTKNILEGNFPSPPLSSNSIVTQNQQTQHQQAIPRSSKSSRFKRLISNTGSRKSSAEDMKAWNEAFLSALETLSNDEVNNRDQAEQEMTQLSGDELEHAKNISKARQQRYVERTRAIKLARDRFFGVAASP
jgi:hypothetical protein